MTTTGRSVTDRPPSSTWVAVVIDVAAPIAVFYLLRLIGVDQVLALLAGAVPPGLRTAWVAVRRRSFDSLAALTLSVIVLTAATSLVTGDARFALARDGVVTTAVGAWILVSSRLRRPFIFAFSTAFMGVEERGLWEECWTRSARFRHGMRVHTTIWGVGFVLDSAVRVVMAYTLPVDTVPLLNGIQYGVLLVLLFTISLVYSRATGLVPGSPDYPAKPTKSARPTPPSNPTHPTHPAEPGVKDS